jgi:hypothetical protein
MVEKFVAVLPVTLRIARDIGEIHVAQGYHSPRVVVILDIIPQK